MTKPLTVGELAQALAGLPQDMVVNVGYEGVTTPVGRLIRSTNRGERLLELRSDEGYCDPEEHPDDAGEQTIWVAGEEEG